MLRFRFSLETLLALRKRREEEAKLALGLKRQAVSRAREQMAGIAEDLRALQEMQKRERKTTLDVNSMRIGVAYRHNLKTSMLKKGEEIRILQEDADRCRLALVKATQKVRSLELLRERRLAEWRTEYNRKAQGFIDDVSQKAYIRRKKAVSG
jgi:flagellar FliJ protein